MRNVRVLALSVLAAAWIADPAVASADGCLQKFSCQVGGECRLPCLDDLLGNRPASPGSPDGAALDTQPTASLPKPDARIDRTTGVTTSAKPTKPKLARHAPAQHQLASLRIVAGRDIASLAQLAGKPVSFGPAGAPAQAAGRKLFARLGIKVEETPLDLDNALDGLATGDIAAVLVARPRDVGKVKGLAGLHVLAAPERAVARGG